MTFVFDIDGTLCDTNEKDYKSAIPDESMIALVNMLYERGEYIILITARGVGSKVDHRQLTEKQLKGWGVQYHELHFGRVVTDWAETPEEFLNDI